MASKALREYHSGPLMLVFLFMVSFQHNVPGYLTPVSFENYTPDNVIPVMYPFFQLTMLIIFVVTIFVLPKLCFFGVGLHPRLFRRHGAKEVAKRFCYRLVYSMIDLVVCAFAFSSEVPCAWLRYMRAWFTLFSGVSSWKPQEQAEREIEEAKSDQLKFWGVLISKTWHVQLTGWVFLILLTWMWSECTTLWFGRVMFLALIAVLTWGRWVLFPAVVWTGCGTVKAELYDRLVNPLSDLLEDNGRVFDAQGTYDEKGDYKGRDTPAERQNDQGYKNVALYKDGDPTDELGNAWPGVWTEFQAIPPYLEAYRLQCSTNKGAYGQELHKT